MNLRMGRLAQHALDEARDVVDGGHRARVLQTHRPDDADRAAGEAVADAVRRGDERAGLQLRRAVLAPDDDVYVAEDRLARDALVQDFDEPRLGLERAEEFPQTLHVGEVRLGEDVRSAVDVHVAGLALAALDAALEQQDGVAQQTVVERLLLAHQRQDLRADGLQGLARELRVQVARGRLKLLVRQTLVDADDLVLDDVGGEHQHDEDAPVGERQKLYVFESAVGHRRRDDDADVLRQLREDVRDLLHQPRRLREGVGREREPAVDGRDVRARQARVADEVVYVKTITLVGRHAPRGGVRLLDEPVLFQLGQHVPDGRRTPTRAARRTLRDGARGHRLARPQVLLDDGRQHGLAARVGRPVGLRR